MKTTSSLIEKMSVYVPLDRRQALLRREELAEGTHGAALFADISGFTPLTELMVRCFGKRRGAEELSRQLNMVYDALITQVHAYGGSVIGFAGDAITCWFDEADEQASMRATACGLALQKAMEPFDRLALPEGQTVTLTLKVAIASGPARRFLVGHSDIQLLEVLAGETVTRMAIAEQLAQKGEVLVDAATIGLVPELEVLAWRRGHERDEQFAVISASELSGDRKKLTPQTNGPNPLNPPLPTLGEGENSPPAPQSWEREAGRVRARPLSLREEALQSWLLPAVYKRLQAGLGEFLTELRPAVALFLRLCCLELDRSEAEKQLNWYISWVQGVVQRYEGTLTHLSIGDKGSYLSVVFGAPVAHEDDARRAVAVALQLRTPPVELSFIQASQIGISLGMMRTGAYGGTMRRTYGVLGDQVNLAARLMTHAKPAQILVSPSAQRAAAPYFTWHALAPIHVKGKSEAISPFEVLAIRQAVGLHQATSTLPIVGRQEELQQIGAKLELAKTKKGQIVGITGEAGIGKSRLVAEVIAFALEQGIAVYGGECQSYATKSPYLVWQPIWRALFGLSAGTSSAEQVKQLQNDITRISPSLLPRVPLLRDVLNLAIPDNELTSSFDAKLRKESREALLVDYLRAWTHKEQAGEHQSKGTPLLLVLEDVHWLDPLSHDLLLAIARLIANLPVLILVAYRPLEVEYFNISPLTELPHFSQIPLAELTSSEAQQLMQAKREELEIDELPADLLNRLEARAEGNPFYLEELLNYLPKLKLDRDSAQALAQLELPPTLDSLVLSRIDQLSQQQQIILKVASIIGRLFPVGWLCGYFPTLGKPAKIQPDLRLLQRQQLTLKKGEQAELAYLFKHVVTQEVIYKSMTTTRRAILHEQLASYLEPRVASDAVGIDLVTYHYAQSSNVAKKREYLQQAAKAAQERYANATAIDYYEQLFELLSTPSERLETLLALGEVLHLVGRLTEAKARYEQALQMASNMTGSAQARCQQSLGILLRFCGDYTEALYWLEQAQASFEALADKSGMSHTLTQIGAVLWQQGAYQAAEKQLQASLLLARELDDKQGTAFALNHLGIVAAQQANHVVAGMLFEQSLMLHRQIGDKWGIANALNNLGNVVNRQGDNVTARFFYEESLLLRREIGHKRGISGSLNNLGLLTCDEGDYAASHIYLEESMSLAREMGDKWSLALSSHNLGLVYYHEGNDTKARIFFEDSLLLWQKIGYKAGIIENLVGLASVTLATGQIGGAVRLTAAVNALLEAKVETLSKVERTLYQQTLTTARSRLNEEAFAAAWAEGQAMTLEEAIDYTRQAKEPKGQSQTLKET